MNKAQNRTAKRVLNKRGKTPQNTTKKQSDAIFAKGNALNRKNDPADPMRRSRGGYRL